MGKFADLQLAKLFAVGSTNHAVLGKPAQQGRGKGVTGAHRVGDFYGGRNELGIPGAHHAPGTT
ncbi:hypothetical protein D3C74_491090 [compost metagenome]